MGLSVTALSLLFASTTNTTAAEDLRLSIAVAPMKNIFSKIREPLERETGIRVVDVNGTWQGVSADRVLLDVDNGTAEAGAGGLDWSNWVEFMQEKGLKVKNLKDMRYRVIGRDRTQIVTHKAVGVTHLSDSDLAKLLSGEVRNWKEVGGKDLPVVTIFSKVQMVMAPYLEKIILGGKPIRKEGTIYTDTIPTLLKAISATPGAIGWVPLAAVTEDVAAPKHSTMGRPLILVVKGRYTPKIERLLKFIETEGPKYGVAR
ncbi:MAG: hypothetical protein NDJ89_11425 [Oligoflexia bacterium]|nr:hypothetical protein [Oligoflexia bacterium]